MRIFGACEADFLCYNKYMKSRITELYHPEELDELRRKIRRGTVITVLIGLLTLAVCVALCCFVTPKNATTLLLGTVVASTLGGWAVISVSYFGVEEHKNAYKHCEAMLSGERERIDGTYELTDERLRVKRGVAMRRIRVDGVPRVGSVQVYDKKADRLKDVHHGALYTVYGFVTAYEEGHADG